MIDQPGSRDLRRAAADFRNRYYGPEGDPGPPPAMAELAPEVMELVDSVVYGEIYNRPAVDLNTRSLCTIAALTVLGHSPQLIKRHIRGALHVGVTKQQICEIISQMVFYGGMPAAVNAFRVAKETFDEVGTPPTAASPGADQTTFEAAASPGPTTRSSPDQERGRSGSGGDGRIYRPRQFGPSDGGTSRPARPSTNRPRPATGGGRQATGDSRTTGRPPLGGRSGPRGNAQFPPRGPGRNFGGSGRKRNPGKRR